jgi:hypothetical protein
VVTHSVQRLNVFLRKKYPLPQGGRVCHKPSVVVFQCHHMPLMDFVASLPVVAEVQPTSEVGVPMRCSYVVPMRWMVIYGYGVPGGALNLNSTNYSDHAHYGDPPPSGKNPHGRAGNRTRYLTISSQKR